MVNQAIQRFVKFNQDYFDSNDPAEFAGILLPAFSFNQLYEIENKDTLPAICDKLYSDLMKELSTGSFGNDIRFQRINYQDAKQESREGPRDYVVITRETNRKTRITILTRFLPYGDKLYVAVDSYVVGSLNLRALIIPVAVTAIPFVCYFLNASLSAFVNSRSPFGGGFQTNNQLPTENLIVFLIVCLAPWLLVTVPLWWIGVIRSYRKENDPVLALRQNYNHLVNSQTFNVDDVLMTLKSALPLIIRSVRNVLEANGLPVKTLDLFIEGIQVVNNISQTVSGNYNAVSVAGAAITNVNPKVDATNS